MNRIDYLASLEDGWLDGAGKAVTPEAIASLRDWFAFNRWDDVPHGMSLFPTEQGGISVEGMGDCEFQPDGNVYDFEFDEPLFGDDLEDELEYDDWNDGGKRRWPRSFSERTW